MGKIFLYLNGKFSSRACVERVGMEMGEARQSIGIFIVDCSNWYYGWCDFEL